MLLILKQFTMKKISVAFLERFRPKDLKMYSQRLNRFLRKRWNYFLLSLFASCGVQNEINTDDFNAIPKQISVRFYDKLDTINYQNDTKFFTRSLLKDFSNREDVDYSKPIELKIIKNDLFLKFETTDKKQYVLHFFGKHHRRKFVFYTNYETITFPILFVRKEMSKYAIHLPNNNELIFENYNVNEGMMLMLGAGNSHQSGYKFKLIKNE